MLLLHGRGLSLDRRRIRLDILIKILVIIVFNIEVVVNHVDEEATAEEALAGQDVVNLFVLLPDDSLVFFLELGDQLLVDLARSSLVALDIADVDQFVGHAPQGARYLVEVRPRALREGTAVDLALSPRLQGDLPRLLFDRMDLVEASFQLLEHRRNFNVFGPVILKLLLDALPVERMMTRKDVELLVEDGLEAEVAHLTGVDGYVFVLLLSLLFSELLGIVRVVP